MLEIGTNNNIVEFYLQLEVYSPIISCVRVRYFESWKHTTTMVEF